MKISVITINYNNRNGLEKTIRSVLSQKEVIPEYIVIDGGSSDGSAELIKQYESKIAYWCSEKDNGIYHAQNKGLLKAGGDYCLFLNSGDFLCHDGVLKEALSYGFDKDIVYGNMRINWGKGQISNGIMPDAITAEHMVKDTLWHPVSFIRRSLFDKFGGYDESYTMVADYEFFFKTVIANSVTTKHIPVYICEYNTEGMSSDPKRKITENAQRQKVQLTYLGAEKLAEIKAKTKQTTTSFSKIVNFMKGLVRHD